MTDLLPPPESIAALRYEDQYLATFGSHFALRFAPDGRGLLPVGLGPINTTGCVYLAVEVAGQRYLLPLAYPPAFHKDELTIREFSLERTMNRVRLTSPQYPAGLTVAWEFTAPFYPQDVRLCTAPFFYVTCSITNDGPAPITVRILGGLEYSPHTTLDALAGRVVQTLDAAAVFRNPETKPGKQFRIDIGLSSPGALAERVVTRAAVWECLAHEIALAPGERRTVDFILAQYQIWPDAVVRSFGVDCRYVYQTHFRDVTEVLDWGRAERATILRKSDFFDALVAGASLPQHIKDFIAWNFHLYKGSTWMLAEPSGKTFYAMYEGGATYFCTVDVEHNLAPFYAMFWPQLLADELALWARGYEAGNRYRPHASGHSHRIMPHDLGGGFELDEQMYILGPMPVEENANFILMHYLYYCYTGDLALFRRHREICLELASYIVESDRNGNGLPDIGANNTLDSFSELMRDCGDQVFLGLKAGCALQALAGLLAADGDAPAGAPPAGGPFLAQATRIYATVDGPGWLGDHYALTLRPDRPEGWDQPWALSANGLAYLLFTAAPIPLHAGRMAQDLAKSAADYSIWPSMGVWRDMEACYFGMLPAIRYAFRPDFRGDMYPRSFNAIAMLQAYAGIGFNRAERRITVSGKATGRFPLTALADWDREQVPWLVISEAGARLDDPSGLAAGLTVEGAAASTMAAWLPCCPTAGTTPVLSHQEFVDRGRGVALARSEHRGREVRMVG